MKDKAFPFEPDAEPLLRAAHQLSPRRRKPPQLALPLGGGLHLPQFAADLVGDGGVLAEISDQLPARVPEPQLINVSLAAAFPRDEPLPRECVELRAAEPKSSQAGRRNSHFGLPRHQREPQPRPCSLPRWSSRSRATDCPVRARST